MNQAQLDTLERSWGLDQRAWIAIGQHPEAIPGPGTSRGRWAEALRVAVREGTLVEGSGETRTETPLTLAQRNAAKGPLTQANHGYWAVALAWDALAKKHAQASQFPFSEALQAAREGLFRAVIRFNPDAKVLFSTYAGWWINATVRKQLYAQVNLVHSNPNTRIDAMRLRDAEDQHGTLSVEDACAEFGWTTDYLARVRKVPWSGAVKSLDAPLKPGQPQIRLGDALGDEDPGVERAGALGLASKSLECGLAFLTERQRFIVTARFGLDGREPRTLRQVGESLGLSRERVRQLEKVALERMRSVIEGRARCLNSR